MANRSVREGIVSVGHAARVRGQDRLRERAARFPHGIVSVARQIAVAGRYVTGANGGRWSGGDAFKHIERMY